MSRIPEHVRKRIIQLKESRTETHKVNYHDLFRGVIFKARNYRLSVKATFPGIVNIVLRYSGGLVRRNSNTDYLASYLQKGANFPDGRGNVYLRLFRTTGLTLRWVVQKGIYGTKRKNQIT